MVFVVEYFFFGVKIASNQKYHFARVVVNNVHLRTCLAYYILITFYDSVKYPVSKPKI